VTLVALSRWGQQQDRNAVMAAGFDYHLTKPTTQEQLQAVFSRRPERSA
jgi:CheY-like chemotaxis protein